MKPFLLLALVLVACNKEPAAAPVTKPAAVVVGGIQTITIVVSDMGYAPEKVELKAGVPVRLIFDQQSKSHCASQIQIPAMGVATTDLPFGKQTAVEFTPKEAGAFNFACGMDMMKGSLLVKS